MTVRSRRALYQPNMFRRSMAYPRSGGFVLPGPSAANPIVSVIVDWSTKDEIHITFVGSVTATVAACGWTYSINEGVDTTPLLATIAGDKLILTMQASLLDTDTYTVSYDPDGCDMAINGNPLREVYKYPGVYIPEPPPPEPLVLENIRTFQEEEPGFGGQIVRKTMIEVEFNQNVLSSSAAGVVSSVQGSGQTINLVRGSGTPKLVYRIQRAIFRHTVTWGYNTAEGDIRAAYGGEELGDVSNDPITNELPQFTVHDWDAGAPNGFDSDTKFDADQTRHDEV